MDGRKSSCRRSRRDGNDQLKVGTRHSLAESQRLAGRVESIIVEVPEVLSVARRTGRAELDEQC